MYFLYIFLYFFIFFIFFYIFYIFYIFLYFLFFLFFYKFFIFFIFFIFFYLFLSFFIFFYLFLYFYTFFYYLGIHYNLKLMRRHRYNSTSSIANCVSKCFFTNSGSFNTFCLNNIHCPSHQPHNFIAAIHWLDYFTNFASHQVFHVQQRCCVP